MFSYRSKTGSRLTNNKDKIINSVEKTDAIITKIKNSPQELTNIIHKSNDIILDDISGGANSVIQSIVNSLYE